MSLTVIYLILGLSLLTAGAEVLVRGGSSLARRLGLTPLVIGLTVVAFGTSAPELVVSVGGALRGHEDIALGNVVGSNIFNVGVILGLAALIAPIEVKLGLLRLHAPLMVGVSVLGAVVAGLEVMPRWAGVILVMLLVVYTVLGIRAAKTQTAVEIIKEYDTGISSKVRSVSVELFLILVGLAFLVLGSNLLVNSTTTIARSLGLSEAAIGLTIVAAGTSMPELATSLVAAIRGQSDIALGNIIGSNIFNILGTLGVASTLRPLSAPGISNTDLWVMVGFSIAVLPLLWTGRRLQRWEGMMLLAGYAAYLWLR